MNRRTATGLSIAMLIAPLARAADSPLKAAFQLARMSGNIEQVLPAFRAAQLFVVARTPGAPDDMNDLYPTPSPKQNGRMCITVAEREETLARISWPKRRVSGEAILRRLPADIEVLIVQPDGGDFLSREHLKWLRDVR